MVLVVMVSEGPCLGLRHMKVCGTRQSSSDQAQTTLLASPTDSLQLPPAHWYWLLNGRICPSVLTPQRV